jgi:hypothetical protein
MNLLNNWREKLFVLSLILMVETGAKIITPLFPRNDFYYAGCASINMLTLAYLWWLPTTVLLRDIFKLVFVQMIFQGLGWLLYAAYFDAWLYNRGIHAIVAVTYLRILMGGTYAGNNTNNPRRLLLHPHH